MFVNNQNSHSSWLHHNHLLFPGKMKRYNICNKHKGNYNLPLLFDSWMLIFNIVCNMCIMFTILGFFKNLHCKVDKLVDELKNGILLDFLTTSFFQKPQKHGSWHLLIWSWPSHRLWSTHVWQVVGFHACAYICLECYFKQWYVRCVKCTSFKDTKKWSPKWRKDNAVGEKVLQT
jgi:hypothetical protein